MTNARRLIPSALADLSFAPVLPPAQTLGGVPCAP